MFSHLQRFAGDPILGLNEAFHRDPRSRKVNLSIGIYFDERGQVPLLATVREAERRMLDDAASKPYLPIEGTLAFRDSVGALLLGRGHEALRQRRVATVQTIGSSGGIKLAAEFVKQWFPATEAWVSDPTWENHRAIFEGSGITVRTYPYYDPQTRGLNFEAMLAAIGRLPSSSVVIVHGCCHNPTGVDLSRQQWDALIAVLARQRVLPFIDLAYQGFAEGLDEDAYPLRAMADAGLPFLVANSFSKNMSLYGERAGALSVVAADAEQAELALGQLQAVARRNWSNPPMHASGVVSQILADTQLRTKWTHEVAQMRQRILDMRVALHGQLEQRLPGADSGYLLAQRGMFSFTGLSPARVDRLREEHSIYLIRSGRMCMAGLNTENVEAVAAGIAAVSPSPLN